MHVLFGSATGFDFSFGNYRSITTIGFLYFVFEHGSSLFLFFLLWAELFGRAWLCFVVFIYATVFVYPYICVIFYFRCSLRLSAHFSCCVCVSIAYV